MNKRHGLLRKCRFIGVMIAVGISVNACMTVPVFGGTSWKEEVLLHDGSKIIVKRSQTYGGRHEIGQSPPVKEQEITFTVPGVSQSITWKSNYSEDIGRSNFKLVALHIFLGVPYVITVPNLCLSYNKWGRPNPPYVIFRYDGKLWQRISIAELPAEFKNINLVVESKGEEKTITAQAIVSAELVRKLNGELEQPEYRSILRKSIPNAGGNRCYEMIDNGKGGWYSLIEFKSKPSLETCLQHCKRHDFSNQHCPCNRLFDEK